MMDDFSQRHSVNQLHGIILQAVIFTNTIHGDNIAVVKARCRFRFTTKPFELFFRACDQGTDDFEGHMPLQRLLHGLVHDSHAAPADFTNYLKITERLRHRKHSR